MSHRLHLTIGETTHRALQVAATTHAARPATLAAHILSAALQAGSLPPTAHATPEHDRPERAQWLQLDRDTEWRDRLWTAVQTLRSEYPEVAAIIHDGWHRDRFTRDGLFALTIWRKQLDKGAQSDPRLELEWLTALAHFKRLHEEHCRQVKPRNPEPNRPKDW